MSKQTYKTQIEILKEKGLYGSMRDPEWDPVAKMHRCCGAPRAYYHLKGCPLCTRDIIAESEPELNESMKWSNLLQNKCPSCNRDLIKTMVATDDDSIACKCGFKCAKQKYAQICADRVTNSIDDESENEEEDVFA